MSCNGENFIVSKRVAFRLLALAVPDPVKTEIKIAYPEHNIMECTVLAIVFSVNAGKLINTQSGGSGIINAVQVFDLLCSPRGRPSKSHAFCVRHTHFEILSRSHAKKRDSHAFYEFHLKLINS